MTVSRAKMAATLVGLLDMLGLSDIDAECDVLTDARRQYDERVNCHWNLALKAASKAAVAVLMNDGDWPEVQDAIRALRKPTGVDEKESGEQGKVKP